MTTALTFNQVTLSPVTHQNRLWIRAAELARALGYSGESKVSSLYRRNAEEFSQDMTQVIEIPAQAQNGLLAGGRARIFSPRGCHLLAMFARTPVAKDFRRWVLDVLDKVTLPQQSTTTALPPTLSTAASRAPLRALVHAWAQVSHQPHAALWAQVKAHFQLSRIDDLPEDWLADALAFVQSKIDAASNPQALPGNSSEIPNSSPMPPTPQPLDVEIPSMALVPPPATPEEYAQRAKVFLADLAKLRAHTFAVFSRASFALAAPYNHRCKGDALPAHKHPFADAMNYSIQDLSMAAVKNISSMELLVTAYVEGQKIVNA